MSARLLSRIAGLGVHAFQQLEPPLTEKAAEVLVTSPVALPEAQNKVHGT